MGSSGGDLRHIEDLIYSNAKAKTVRGPAQIVNRLADPNNTATVQRFFKNASPEDAQAARAIIWERIGSTPDGSRSPNQFVKDWNRMDDSVKNLILPREELIQQARDVNAVMQGLKDRRAGTNTSGTGQSIEKTGRMLAAASGDVTALGLLAQYTGLKKVMQMASQNPNVINAIAGGDERLRDTLQTLLAAGARRGIQWWATEQQQPEPEITP